MWTAEVGPVLHTIIPDIPFADRGYQVSWKSGWRPKKFDPFPYKSLEEVQKSVLDHLRPTEDL